MCINIRHLVCVTSALKFRWNFKTFVLGMQICTDYLNEIIAFLNTKNINITINFIEVCLGTFKSVVDNSTVNYIIMLMKHYIFRTKQTNNIPALNCFINYLKSKINEEQEIAIFKDQSELHNRKEIQLTNI